MSPLNTASTLLEKDESRTVKRRAKGEQTRAKILDASLRLIAKHGLRSVTHRAVAAEAGVQLSLTTYYFKDIQDLIGASFVHYTNQGRAEVEEVLNAIEALIQKYPAAERRKSTVKQQLCDELAAVCSDIMIWQITENADALKIEQIFMAEVSLSDQLRQHVDAFLDQVFQKLQKLCRLFNRQDPEIDAELIMRTLISMEYNALDKPFGDAEQEKLRLQVKRLFGWVLGLKQYR